MKKKILALLAVLALAFAMGTASAGSASAYTYDGNYVWNYGQNGDVAVEYYNGTWFYPPSGRSVGSALCVRPQVYMKSQWGGGYAAGVTRCFTTPNNTLKLYRI